ncbi:1-deoxy-D-xylulose-5-phosphate synthase N-terminal domain-containing protein [Campylobacter jejuni]
MEILPDKETYISKRCEERIKLINNRLLFENLGIKNIDPIDVHNISTIITVLNKANDY